MEGKVSHMPCAQRRSPPPIAPAAGTLPLAPSYSCDPTVCLPANNCRCASQDPPIDANKTDQILSVRVWLNETCGIPFEDMVGMRDPFLVNNPGTREVRERVQEFPCMCCVSACARAGDGGWLASPARWIRHECSQG